MVLALLGTSFTSAIQLDVITSALFQADFDIKHISKLEIMIEQTVTVEHIEGEHDEREITKQVYFNELCKVLDPGEPSFTPKKGEQSIVMFVGLQGSGKTTTCMKYAYCHRNRGWKPAMVCVDQLKENVTEPTIPFYGSYKESDPVTIAVEGVKIYKEENHDLIIIDASGGHHEEASLIEEMDQLYQATRPDLVIFVMDSTIGQAAFDQAQALKHHLEVGAVILTQGGGGAQCGGVAATKSPVISDMDNEESPLMSHMDDFEIFKVKPLVERCLGLMEETISGTSSYTFRTLRKKYESLLSVPAKVRKHTGMTLHGFSAREGSEAISARVERYMPMIDSMTNEELDCSNPKWIKESMMMRIARDSGHQVSDVEELLDSLKYWAKTEVILSVFRKSRNLLSSSRVIVTCAQSSSQDGAVLETEGLH